MEPDDVVRAELKAAALVAPAVPLELSLLVHRERRHTDLVPRLQANERQKRTTERAVPTIQYSDESVMDQCCAQTSTLMGMVVSDGGRVGGGVGW